MNTALQQLCDFHTAFHRHMESIPTTAIPLEVKAERKMLITEETKELLQAIDEEPLENITKELCDVLYAIFGTAVAFGLTEHLEAAFNEVHRSNMSKLDREGKPLIREDGKILKSELYSPADMSAVFNHNRKK